MLSKNIRLRDNRDFSSIYKTGFKVRGDYGMLIGRKSERLSFGLITGKKIGDACVRNKLRRQVSEIFNELANSQVHKIDIVYIGHKSADDFAELKKEVLSQFYYLAERLGRTAEQNMNNIYKSTPEPKSEQSKEQGTQLVASKPMSIKTYPEPRISQTKDKYPKSDNGRTYKKTTSSGYKNTSKPKMKSVSSTSFLGGSQDYSVHPSSTSSISYGQSTGSIQRRDRYGKSGNSPRGSNKSYGSKSGYTRKRSTYKSASSHSFIGR